MNLTLSHKETLISECMSMGRRPVHGLSYSVWNLSNPSEANRCLVGELHRGKRLKDKGTATQSSQILRFRKGLCLWQILDHAHPT